MGSSSAVARRFSGETPDNKKMGFIGMLARRK
jgi:hypothetical protein